jgi:hypothetical protein
MLHFLPAHAAATALAPGLAVAPATGADPAPRRATDDLARAGVPVRADQSAQAVNKLRALLGGAQRSR